MTREWGLQQLPEVYHGLLRQCLKEYCGAAVAEGYEPRELTDFAEYMMAEIKRNLE
ncbi:aminoglycoside adenylyltransferase domain-containing protein [Paenibacillus sp. FSL P2-0089]|uniref:aminoglycoside adenylyltransferase domain-containing protein n=1 Tax=Paenibacillus sp. FSL P2-0089 TaxID=2954526 RepID=UPI00315A9451